MHNINEVLGLLLNVFTANYPIPIVPVSLGADQAFTVLDLSRFRQARGRFRVGKYIQSDSYARHTLYSLISTSPWQYYQRGAAACTCLAIIFGLIASGITLVLPLNSGAKAAPASVQSALPLSVQALMLSMVASNNRQ